MFAWGPLKTPEAHEEKTKRRRRADTEEHAPAAPSLPLPRKNLDTKKQAEEIRHSKMPFRGRTGLPSKSHGSFRRKQRTQRISVFPLPCRLGLSGQAATPIPASVTYAGKPPALPFSWSPDYCVGLRILVQGLLRTPSPFPGSPLSPVLRIPNPSYHRNNCTRNAIRAEQILGRSSFGRPVHESHPVAAISPLQSPLKQERVLPA